MSKLIKNEWIVKFFSAFGLFANLKTETAINVLKDICDNTKIGYFEKVDTVQNGSDKALKKWFTETLELFFKEQAEVCKEDIMSLPEDIWSDDTPSKANVQVFEVTQSTGGTIILKAGSTFKMVRAAFMHIANTESRLHAWNWIHSDMAEAKEKLYEVRQAIADANQAAKDAKAQTEETESTDPEPDGDGTSIDVSDFDPTMANALERLTKTFGGAELSKGQVGAIAKMVNDISDHIDSLTGDTVVEPDAPKVSTKKPVQKTATK